MPVTTNENVLVGYGTADDAGVYKLRDDLAIVQTVDFFTPIVDDPFDFGRIAAANALSDVYAMGATPISALNIATFPIDTLDAAILSQILAGGASVAQQAGVAILGGHTIKDTEPKYGLAVVGTIHPKRIVTNADARPGDILVLTKPIGTGILSTALKRGVIDEAAMRDAVEWMAALNDRAGAAMQSAGVHAATDITGFGLLGHAHEMARGSNAALHIDAASVPGASMIARSRFVISTRRAFPCTGTCSSSSNATSFPAVRSTTPPRTPRLPRLQTPLPNRFAWRFPMRKHPAACS